MAGKLITATHDGTIRIENASTGNVTVGHWNEDGTSLASSEHGESYEVMVGLDWSLWGYTIYPVGDSGCLFGWEFHIELPEAPFKPKGGTVPPSNWLLDQ